MLNHPLSTIMAFTDDSITYRVLQEAWKMVANKDSEILNRALALLGVFNAAPNGGSGYLALIFWATLMFQFGRVMTQEDWKENAVPTILWSCGAFWALGNFKKVYVLIFAGGAALSNVFDTYVFGTVIPNPQSWTDQFVSKLQNVVQSGWSLLLSPLNGFFMLIEFVTLIILMIAIVRVAFTFVVGTFVSTVFFAPCLAVYPIPESRRATHLTFRVLVSLSLYPVMWKVILHLGVWVFDSLMANVFILGGLISCFKNLAIGYLLWQVPKWALAVTDGTFAQVATLGASEAAGQAASAFQQVGKFLLASAIRFGAPLLGGLAGGKSATTGGAGGDMDGGWFETQNGEVVGSSNNGLGLPGPSAEGSVAPPDLLGSGHNPRALPPPPDYSSGNPVGPSGPDGLPGPTIDGKIVEPPPALTSGQNQLSASTSPPPDEPNTSGPVGGSPNPSAGGGSRSGLTYPGAGSGPNPDDAVTEQNPLGLLPGQELLPPEPTGLGKPNSSFFNQTGSSQPTFPNGGSRVTGAGAPSPPDVANCPDAEGQNPVIPAFDAAGSLPEISSDSGDSVPSNPPPGTGTGKNNPVSTGVAATNPATTSSGGKPPLSVLPPQPNTAGFPLNPVADNAESDPNGANSISGVSAVTASTPFNLAGSVSASSFVENGNPKTSQLGGFTSGIPASNEVQPAFPSISSPSTPTISTPVAQPPSASLPPGISQPLSPSNGSVSGTAIPLTPSMPVLPDIAPAISGQSFTVPSAPITPNGGVIGPSVMSMPVSNNPSSAPGNFASPGMIPPPPDSTTATVSLVSSPAPLAWNPPAPVQQSGLPSSSFGVPTVSANPMTPAMGVNRSVPNQMAGNHFDNSPLPSFNPPPPAPTVISGLVLPPPNFD